MIFIDNMKTPSSMDTQLESDTSTTPSSNHLQLPTSDLSHDYPKRESTSAYSRSTLSSTAKYKVDYSSCSFEKTPQGVFL